MAKSKIIVDIANGAISIQIALKRAKILLQELDDDSIMSWINSEIEGYSNEAEVPQYRKITGTLRGSYFKGSMANHITYTNVSLPLGEMPDDLREMMLTTNITQGVEALKQMVDECMQSDYKALVKSLPADIYSTIAHYNNDPYMIITSANVDLNMPQLMNIFSKVENKLLDILYYLEKQFGNLDSFDLDISGKDKKELHEIVNHIQVIIYNDSSVSLGDNNKVRDSSIASIIKNLKNQ